MLTTRIYRAARPAAEALNELRRAAGPVLPAHVARARADPPARRRRERERVPSCSPPPSSRRPREVRDPGPGGARPIERSCISAMLYPSCVGARRHPAVAGSTPRHWRPSAPDPPSLLRRADPRRAARCAERLGRSPTMREFAADEETQVHPQTVIEHFGSWNAAKRHAGLVPRRFATREELLAAARLGEELGRTPTARDLDEPGRDALEVALLAHVRLAHERAARGRVRRPRGGGAAGARGRAGRRARPHARPPAEVRRLGRRAPGRPGAPDRMAGLPDVRRRSRGVVGVPVPRPRAPARGGRRGAPGRPVALAARSRRRSRRAAAGRRRPRAGADGRETSPRRTSGRA